MDDSKSLYAVVTLLLFLLGAIAGNVAALFSIFGFGAYYAAFLEEVLKALVLFVFFQVREDLFAAFYAFVCGAILGLGFGVAETMNYFILHYYHDLSLLALRFWPLLMHVFTAGIFGYSLYLSKRNKIWALFGFIIAVLVHLSFNYVV
jgi:RsiW-degrading membrane proteinase PrsW (M82 family)